MRTVRYGSLTSRNIVLVQWLVLTWTYIGSSHKYCWEKKITLSHDEFYLEKSILVQELIIYVIDQKLAAVISIAERKYNSDSREALRQESVLLSKN